MTMRERLEAMLRGEPVDRVPLVIYEGLGATPERLIETLGAHRLGFLRWSRCYDVIAPNCKRVAEEVRIDGRPAFRITLTTPAGSLCEERFRDPPYKRGGIHRYFIQDEADYRVLLAYLDDIQIVTDFTPIQQATADLGDRGLVHCAVPRTPYQQLIAEWVDPEELNWHLLNESELLLACIDSMIDIQHRIFQIVLHAPIPYVVVPDNIHAPLIGRTHFNKYCIPLYNQLAAILADRGIPVIVHMDGELRQLWYDIEDSLIGGIEAFSVGQDLQLSEVVEACPSMILGAQFPTGIHLKPASIVYEQALDILAAGARMSRFFLQIAEPIPHGRWRISLPSLCKAIDDFTAANRQ